MTEIKKKLREEIDKRNITTLKVFDFDGTTVNTPTPQEGKKTWEEKTGNKWPHRGWWGKKESLNMDVFEMNTIPSTIKAHKEAMADPNTLTVLMTGRLSGLEDDVKAILESHGLGFDEYYFNTGGSTTPLKMKQMESILGRFPSIQTVELWEDRHLDEFREWGKTIEPKFVLHEVKPEDYE